MATQHYPEQQAYPPQSYPPQGQPPSYNYNTDQTGYNYQPQSASASNLPVMAQPAGANTSSVPHPEAGNPGLAVGALVFSVITLLFCGSSIIFLCCAIPGFILAIEAMRTEGSSQTNNARISICLNITTFICFTVILGIVVPILALAL